MIALIVCIYALSIPIAWLLIPRKIVRYGAWSADLVTKSAGDVWFEAVTWPVYLGCKIYRHAKEPWKPF